MQGAETRVKLGGMGGRLANGPYGRGGWIPACTGMTGEAGANKGGPCVVGEMGCPMAVGIDGEGAKP